MNLIVTVAIVFPPVYTRESLKPKSVSRLVILSLYRKRMMRR